MRLKVIKGCQSLGPTVLLLSNMAGGLKGSSPTNQKYQIRVKAQE
jgi:hypothetical protein